MSLLRHHYITITSLYHRYYINITHYYNYIITYYYLIITTLLRHYYVIITTSLLHILRHYYVIIKSLLLIITGSLLHIITSLLHHYYTIMIYYIRCFHWNSINTYYYHYYLLLWFETEQLADAQNGMCWITSTMAWQLRILDKDIPCRFGKLRKFGFMLKILVSSHWDAFMILWKGQASTMLRKDFDPQCLDSSAALRCVMECWKS